MLMRRIVIAGLLLALPRLPADTLQLKDKAAVTGKILAEKKDQVVVDVGYTVLVVPRSQIARIVKSDPDRAPVEKPEVATNAPPVETSSRLFQSGRNTGPERSVRDLVNLLGSAVVQVRTPGGLGSGFIISEEGYLITNFHVIENETQISVEVYHQINGQLERKSYKQVRIVAMNKFADLALLKIEDKDTPGFARVPLGDSVREHEVLLARTRRGAVVVGPGGDTVSICS